MEQFIYAPVVIPTICRYNTFKPCIDSLSRCTDADKTELYIGLDYPAKESHWEGYRKICDYVQDIKGFKSVYIFKREYNYGQGKNMEDLLKHVKEKYDRYIVSEDDNVFSPNFLEYINYGLEKYRDHPDVIAICGFNYPFSYMENIIGYEKNAFPITAFTAWGVGLWFDKKPIHFVNKDKAKEIIYSWKMVRKLWKHDMHATIHRLLSRYERAYSDLMWHLYCVIYRKYAIFPAISKVRNLGFEGDATNCRPNPIYAKQRIDDTVHFKYDDFDIKDYPAIMEVHNKMFDRNFLVRRLCELEYLMFRLTGHVLRDIPFIRYFQRRNVNRDRT